MEELKKVRDYYIFQQKELQSKYHEFDEKYKKIFPLKNKQIKEKIELKIELNKIDGKLDTLYTIIKTLNIIMKNVNEEVSILHDISSSKEAIDRINSILEEKFIEIDIVSKQESLVKEFQIERKGEQGKNSFVPFQMLAGFFTVYIFGIPLIHSSFIPYSILNYLLIATLSFSSGYLLAKKVFRKIINDRVEIFDRLNEELGEEAVSKKIDYYRNEEYLLSNLKKQKINEVNVIVNKTINELIFENTKDFLQNESVGNKENTLIENSNLFYEDDNSEKSLEELTFSFHKNTEEVIKEKSPYVKKINH